uniref:Uncharacterized protein n=1 Tax=Arundo donax TaxID=35708 RepID=A0A0A8Y2K3_ARUDO
MIKLCYSTRHRINELPCVHANRVIACEDYKIRNHTIKI